MRILKQSLWAAVMAVIVLVGSVSYAQTAATQVPLTPAQTAYLNSEVQKARDRFVVKVAEITDARRSTVRRAIPAKGRITDPVNRMIASLEQSLEHPLTDEQKAQIAAAETVYRQEVLDAQASARKK